MTALPEGFIPHDGGPCPVEPQVMVQVIFRKESADDFDAEYCPAGAFRWSHKTGARDMDIIAYKPTQQEPTHD